MVMRRAPFKIPSGLKASARFRKLFRGLPSSSVLTPGDLLFGSGSPTTTSPSYLSATYKKAYSGWIALLFVRGILRAQRDRQPASKGWRPPSHISSSRTGAGRAAKRAP